MTNTALRTPEVKATETNMKGITQAQKQALMDNLQLEITERARKLRAQYALQAQGLRARLELRVNRIPQALRKRKIQDLLDEHAESMRPKRAPAVPVQHTSNPSGSIDIPARKPLKRTSDYMAAGDDKENQPSQSQEVANPKKRAKKDIAPANAKGSRAVSRKVVPSTVLSPKSHNSRTLSRSPIKPSTSFVKRASPRPASPLKPSASHPVRPAQAKQQRDLKSAPPTSDSEGRSSEASNLSAGTTIITKAGSKAKSAAAAAGRKAAAITRTAAVGRRPKAAAKRENAPPVSSGTGRTLRKRG